MEKEELKKNQPDPEDELKDNQESVSKKGSDKNDKEEEEEKLSPEEEIESLKDKIARTFAEMENQRRRFEKEKDDAFEYGGFSYARESLNLLDNL